MNGHIVEMRVRIMAAHARVLNSARAAVACMSPRDADVQVSQRLQVCQSSRTLVPLVAIF